MDTAPLVALCDPRDSLHARALVDLDRHKGRPFASCEAVLGEACFLLPNSVQRERLRRLLAELPIRPFMLENEDLWDEVFTWLFKYRDHDPDWADGTLVVLSSREARAKIWTYDAEFATTWRRLDGSRVPLFVDPRRR